LKAAEAELDQVRDLPSPARPEQRDLHRDQVSKAHRRSSSNMASSSQRDDQLRNQTPRTAGQDKFRRRVTREDLSVSGSARRHLWAQLNISSVERLDFGNRSRPRLGEEMRMKRAPNEKECRPLTVSRLRHNSTSSRSSGSKAARLQQLITARAMGSRKVERGNQRKRHRQGRINFGAVTPAAPERENSGAAFLDVDAAPLRSRSRNDGWEAVTP
jgi:hypothetical protein